MQRAGRRSLRRARQKRREFVQEKAPFLALFLAIYLAVAVVLLQVPQWPTRAFRQGCLLMGLLWLLSWLVSMDNAEGLRLGGLAERWTSADLRKLRRVGWTVIDRVEFEDMDVDHVAISAHGVVAVETKYSANPKRFQGESLEEILD